MQKGYTNLHCSLLCRLWSSGKEENPSKSEAFCLGSNPDMLDFNSMHGFLLRIDKGNNFFKI